MRQAYLGLQRDTVGLICFVVILLFAMLFPSYAVWTVGQLETRVEVLEERDKSIGERVADATRRITSHQDESGEHVTVKELRELMLAVSAGCG